MSEWGRLALGACGLVVAGVIVWRASYVGETLFGGLIALVIVYMVIR